MVWIGSNTTGTSAISINWHTSHLPDYDIALSTLIYILIDLMDRFCDVIYAWQPE